MAQISISGHLFNSSGAPIANASVVFQLINYGGNLPYVSGTNILAPVTVTFTTNGSGVFSGNIQGNDTITPSGTVYQVSYGSGVVASYSFTGAGPINLDSFPPLSQVPAPSGPLPSNILTSNNVFTGSNTFNSSITVNGAVFTALFSDAETPSGLINGSNVTFTLAHTPNPATSLMLFLNGVLQRAGAGNDYTIATATITMATAPITNDILLVSYRY